MYLQVYFLIFIYFTILFLRLDRAIAAWLDRAITARLDRAIAERLDYILII